MKNIILTRSCHKIVNNFNIVYKLCCSLYICSILKLKKIITTFLILVMVLQLLPVKQAIRYFFIDNVMVEEILHVNKNATKNFKLLDEDHIIPDFDFSQHQYFLVNNKLSHYFTEVLPAVHAAEIHTPPPNIFLI